MKAFIFISALIACLVLARALPLEEKTIEAAVAPGITLPITLGSPSPQCKEVGGLCHQSDDCCTLRCASYINRCVT